MEQFIEMSVSRKNKIKDYAICFVLCMLPILVGSYLIMLTFALKNTGLLMVAIVVAAILYFVSYNIFNSFNVDYEYAIVEDEIRFAKIINKSKRRELLTVNFSNVKLVSNIKNKQHLSMQIDKSYSFISQTNDEYYYMLASTKQGRNICIYFEPNERMKNNISARLRNNFYI